MTNSDENAYLHRIELFIKCIFRIQEIMLSDLKKIKLININPLLEKLEDVNKNFEIFEKNHIKRNIPIFKEGVNKKINELLEGKELRKEDEKYLNTYNKEQEEWENFIYKDYINEKNEIINIINENIEIINYYNEKNFDLNKELNEFKNKIINLICGYEGLKPHILYIKKKIDFFKTYELENRVAIFKEIIKEKDIRFDYDNIYYSDKTLTVSIKEEFNILQGVIKIKENELNSNIDQLKNKNENLKNKLETIKNNYKIKKKEFIFSNKKNHPQFNGKSIYKEN